MSNYSELLDILYEDNHLLAMNKPAGWPTTHFDGKEETVDRLVKAYLKEKYQKPGNVFLGVVHRLDKPTSGTLLFARTSKAASRLSEQFRDGGVEKKYWAVVSDSPSDETPWKWAEAGSMDDFLLHDDEAKSVRVVSKTTPNAKPARMLYRIISKAKGMILLELTPHTGRKHQIRVQLSSRGFPILGDAKYGSPVKYGTFIALHARALTILHPTTGNPVEIQADVPKSWRGRFAHVLPKS